MIASLTREKDAIMTHTSNKHQAGMHGQTEAEQFLISKGYQILCRNYRVKTGEIDIIARLESYIIFVEVKYRRGLKFGYPREAVGSAKQRRVIRTALYYIGVHALVEQDFRFDVIEVLEQNGQISINHIENAFDA